MSLRAWSTPLAFAPVRALARVKAR